MRRRNFIKGISSSAIAWPLAARAQQSAPVKRIGVLMPYAESDAEAQGWVRIYVKAMEQLGWAEGRNIQTTYRWASASADKVQSYAKELVDLKPDLLLSISTPSVAALARETRSIPVVFLNVADPVGQGIVSNLARPGGNITGFSAFEFSMGGKWIEALKEISPSITRVAVIYNPETAPYYRLFLRWIESAAQSAAVKSVATPIHDAAGIEQTIFALSHESNIGLIVIPSILFTVQRQLIIDQAARYRVPAIYPYRYNVPNGGLIAYGVDMLEMYRRAGSYVDRILKGAKPSELPVQQPTKFELAVNMKTAKALGLTVPQTLLARADEVIE